MSKKVVISFIFFFFFFGLPRVIHASTLSLLPASTKISTGATTAVSVRLNGAEGINAVSAILTYPADKLQVMYVSGSGTFGIAAENNYGGGGIRISRGSFSPVSGTVTVATIGFKGKSQGSATVSFTGESSAYKASDNTNSLTATAGGTYTVVQGAPAVNKQEETTQKDTTKPKISSVVVTSVTKNSATITWNTDKSSDSYVEYGLEAGKYFLSASTQQFVQNHSIKLEGQALSPGNKYHFRVKSTDASGNQAEGTDTTFQLIGYTVKVRVVNELNAPVANAKVALYSDPQTATTNRLGEATFTNVTFGKHVAVANVNGTEKTKEVMVTDSVTSQNVTIQVIPQKQNSNVLLLIPVMLLLFLVIALGYMMYIKNRNKTHTVITNKSAPS